MPRSQNQKLKILYLAKILGEQTDETHALTLEEIRMRLEGLDISAERKSLYADIETLRQFGMDIHMVRGERTVRYFVASRDFEVPELKLLVDSVQANQFLTEKKTYKLIKKLEQLCSRHEAELLRRQVYVTNRIKTMNESIFYNVDAIHSAIADDKQIAFKYFIYTVDKKKQYRHNGAIYKVSPYALTLNADNYYLIAFDEAAGKIKHYRVDKMDKITVCEDRRVGGESFREIDIAEYMKHTFGMFGGKKERITVVFKNALAGVVTDRFGKDIPLIKTDDEHFKIYADVAVSPQFFGWIFALEGDAVILEPEHVAKKYAELLNKALNSYE